MSDEKEQVVITLKLFGVFRQCAEVEQLQLPLPKGSTLSLLRDALKKMIVERCPDFTQVDLVDYSAFADDQGVVGSDRVFEHDLGLAILPPVCGG